LKQLVVGTESLFAVQRRGAQVFLELDMPKRSKPGEKLVIRHTRRTELAVDLATHVEEHPTNDQSTAHHKDAGLLLAWCKGARAEQRGTSVPVTAIAPAVLRLFGVAPQPWMRDDPGELFVASARAEAA